MSAQRDVIDRLAQRGQDTRLAEMLLHAMQTALDNMTEHREMIERAIAAGWK